MSDPKAPIDAILDSVKTLLGDMATISADHMAGG